MEKPKGFRELTREYYDYMDSEEWKKVRTERLKFDGFRCANCGNPSNLEVHHIRYPENLYLTNINDVITLCRMCHRSVEIQKDSYRKAWDDIRKENEKRYELEKAEREAERIKAEKEAIESAEKRRIEYEKQWKEERERREKEELEKAKKFFNAFDSEEIIFGEKKLFRL